MAWQWTPYTIPLIVAAAIAAISALYMWWRHRHLPWAKTGALLMLACAVWTLGYALEIGSANLPTKVFWAKVQHVGVIAPTVWLIFVLQYTGREKWLTGRNLTLLSIVPLITLLLVFTNEAHGLVWSHAVLNTDGPLSVLEHHYSVGFSVFLVYAYILALLGSVLFIQMLIRSRHLYRWQAIALLFAVFIPFLGTTLQLSSFNPFPYLKLAPLTFAVSSLILGWSLFRLQLGDIVRVGREVVIDGMSDSVMVLDAQNRLVDLNPAAQHLIGHTLPEAIGQPVKQVWPDWPGQIERPRDMAEVGKELVLGQEDEQRTYDVRISPLVDWRGHLVSLVVVLREITERVRAEEQIKASLKEKEVLLKEIHHRVKNNLQVISSLLYLQSKSSKDEEALAMFQESRNRVRSMALVHERLYQSQDLARVDFAEYVRSLANHLFRSYGVNTNVIRLKINSDDVLLGVDTAIPCGLIINELVSNCLKHAFLEGREGEVRIEFRSDDGECTLMVSDNGVGFPKDLNFRDTGSLGLQLVNTLVHQLEGTIELDRSSGTAFKITFTEPRR